MNPCSCSTCAALLTHTPWISRVTHQLTSTHRENTAQANFNPNQKSTCTKPNQQQIQEWFVLIPTCSVLNWCQNGKIIPKQIPTLQRHFHGHQTRCVNRTYKQTQILISPRKGSFVHHLCKKCGCSHSIRNKTAQTSKCAWGQRAILKRKQSDWSFHHLNRSNYLWALAQTGNSQKRQNKWILAEVSKADAWLVKTENYLMWSQWKLPVFGLPLTAWWICARAAQTLSSFPSLRSPSAPRLNWKTPAERMILSDNMMGLAESH